MKKSTMLIWTTAAVLGAVSLFYNLRAIPEEKRPDLQAGEFYCPPEIQIEANRLKPQEKTVTELAQYPELIKNAPSPSEAWRLETEAAEKADAYNRQIRLYNEYLLKNCQR